MNRRLEIVAVFVICVSSALSAGARPHRHAREVLVRFVATSTLIRGKWGYNEDAYRAQVVFPKQHEAVLVRLIDAYSSDWPPLSHQALTSETGARLAAGRDAKCDLPFRRMLLRMTSGDPMAISPERLEYHPFPAEPVAPETVLPCYRVKR